MGEKRAREQGRRLRTCAPPMCPIWWSVTSHRARGRREQRVWQSTRRKQHGNVHLGLLERSEESFPLAPHAAYELCATGFCNIVLVCEHELSIKKSVSVREPGLGSGRQFSTHNWVMPDPGAY